LGPAGGRAIEGLGGATAGEAAAEVVVLGHRDLGAELVGDLTRGQLAFVEQRGAGLAEYVLVTQANSPLPRAWDLTPSAPRQAKDPRRSVTVPGNGSPQRSSTSTGRSATLGASARGRTRCAS
jgi:hypothetical protein